MKPKTSAFTLLELVIALAIAAVLVVYAVPSYHNHVARSHRVDAASALYRAAQFIEANTSNDANQSSAQLPSGFDQAPLFGTAVYKLRVLPADDSNGGYALEARPVESGPMQDDACGTFILDATGLRTNHAADGSAVSDAQSCWNTR
ncbi:type IV pilin protein [Paraburkholderia sp. DHOC27]|uniref:type IV pilin protein n=1 Tax=Paraburkholderia sp. DHOC27 TaxID=2303330 RepID=UPI000E3D94D2|nr:type IV pilin protein [Paraburkholderia sp. DHOC27]RFU45912.1 prepilin-type N-terminal cleavage/methylation domain-containing protein [Paraburkholderia sp. DHOC27]